MSRAFNWVKAHKLLTFNLLIVGYFIFRLFSPQMLGSSLRNTQYSSGGVSSMELGYDSDYSYPIANKMVSTDYYREAPPQPDVTDRKVVVNSNFSLLVKNVVDTLEQIKTKTTELSGYIVSSSLNKQEYGESATIQIRIPTSEVETITKYLRGLAVKVVSEKVSGNDITDQYMDVERRISDLEKQRVRMEVIMDSTKTVNEMLEVQRGLFQIQDQIDMYKGKILYMEGTTKTSKLTIYISTDELSLPYTPDKPWRPEVVLKQAIRSMLGTLQSLGSFIIWLAVYAPLVIAVIIVIRLIRRRKRV